MKKHLLTIVLSALMLVCIIPTSLVYAEGETEETPTSEGVAIDETNFPDANFREYVKKFDLDKNDSFSDEEIAKVTRIECYSKGIGDLKGIENFTALTWLDCSTNKLTSLDLTKNIALEHLNCGTNQLTSLDVTKNTALTYFSCNRNMLTSLDLSNNTELQQLYCDYNQLTSLDLTNNNKISYGCNQNKYNITVNNNNTFDLTKLPGNFDISKASDFKGATVNGETLTVSDKEITYTYSLRNNNTAKFALVVDKYTISFETDGGSKIDDQVINYNELVDKPNNPVKEGHTFIGWYLDKDLTQAYDFNTPVTSGLTLYASYKINEYTISFETNGGNKIEDQTVKYGELLTKPSDPTKAGYTFKGWYLDKELTKAYDFNTSVNDALTLYAKWIKNEEPSNGPTSAGSKDKNSDGIISCEEEMNSKNWIWSNTKKACVYKVSNTKTR